jgi:hypothetical protein
MPFWLGRYKDRSMACCQPTRCSCPYEVWDLDAVVLLHGTWKARLNKDQLVELKDV